MATRKLTINVPEIPCEDELVDLQGVILDLPLGSDSIVFFQRVIKQTISQVYDQVPNAAQEDAPKRKGKAKLEYYGNLAEPTGSEEK